MKPKQKPFRFFLRREGSYELSLSVRFEVAEGYGALVLQRKDANKDPPPTLVYEEREITAKELRGGRFIHVLPGSSRRQSYALSRLTEDMLQQIPDDGWTELNALTEYGFRYLVTPENLPVSHKPAAVQVSAAAAPVAAAAVAAPAATVRAAPAAAVRVSAAAVRAAPPPPAPNSDTDETDEADEDPTAIVAPSDPNAPLLKAQSPGGAPSALQRAMAAIRAGRVAGSSITGNSEAKVGTPRPAPTAKVSNGGGMTTRATKPAPVSLPPAPSPTTAADADRLGHAEAIAKVKELAARLADLERKYADGLARERDLIEVLTRWQEREIS